MSSATPATSIEARLAANWTVTPIAVPNEAFVPPLDADSNPAPFIELEFPGGVGMVWGIGSPGANSFREDGAFQVHVCVASGTGTALARDYADQVSAIFRGQAFDTSVVCYAPHPPQESASPDGVYYVLTVAIPYAYQFRG